MDFIKKFAEAHERYQAEIDKISAQYLKKYQVVPIGTTFEYEGEVCTVVGAKLDIDLVDYINELTPEINIIYLIDIPQWRLESKPDMKVRWNQKTLVSFLNGELPESDVSF